MGSTIRASLCHSSMVFLQPRDGAVLEAVANQRAIHDVSPDLPSLMIAAAAAAAALQARGCHDPKFKPDGPVSRPDGSPFPCSGGQRTHRG